MNFKQLIIDNIAEIIAGSITVITAYFGIGRITRKRDSLKVEFETDDTIRKQLLKVNAELSKVFGLHVEEVKKHHAVKVENVKLSALIENIKNNCPSDCLESLLDALNKDNTDD